MQRYRVTIGEPIESWDDSLHTLSSLTSASEHQLIEAEIEKFTDSFVLNFQSALPMLHRFMQKPMRPIWIHPQTAYFDFADYNGISIQDLQFDPVYCLCASMPRNSITSVLPFSYIQGAADDAESWARSLTPEQFWDDPAKYLDGYTVDIAVLACNQHQQTSPHYNMIGDSGIAIGSYRSQLSRDAFDIVINCGALPSIDGCHYFEIPEGKKGKKQFINCIPDIISLADRKKKVLIHCMQGKDRSVGMAIAVLLARQETVDKRDIEKCLIYIQKYHHTAMPSRTTMKQLHLYFSGLPPANLSKLLTQLES